MSRTEMKNGKKVEDAIKYVAMSKDSAWFGIVTIGEVARVSGKSKPTVQKYFQKLVDAGLLYEHPRDMRYCVKTTPKSFQWLGDYS